MIWIFAFIILPAYLCLANWRNWKRANKAEQRLKDSLMEIDMLKERLHAVALENERRRVSLDVYEKRFTFYQKTPSIMSAISDALLKGFQFKHCTIISRLSDKKILLIISCLMRRI